MRYAPLSSHFYIGRRKALKDALEPNSIAILFSNDIYPTNADGTFQFHPNADLFYTTGIDQEETILLLFKNAPKASWEEILFIQETNEQIKIWEGAKLSKAQAREISGIQHVYWTHEFESVLHQLVFEAQNLYLNQNEHVRAKSGFSTKERRMIDVLKQNYPLHQYKRLAPLLHLLRSIKEPEEISQIQKAIEVTGEAFRRILKMVKPGVYEYQLEAEMIHTFVWNGADGHAFQPIIASGADTCVLHYHANNKMCKDGDLLLLDFGAAYGRYNADLSRTIPVNGRFNTRQKEVYQAVLEVQQFAKTLLLPGEYLESYHTKIGKFVEEQLIRLKLFSSEEIKNQNPEKPLYKRYFMHGTSHHLGLDVHDVGSRFLPFRANMILTCEPGIYIPEENIGIRIENDVLLTEKEPIDLMKGFPITVEEIEGFMGSKSK